MISAAFFTRPQFCPSGVSDGHSLPHCVGCRSRASKWGWLLVSEEVILLRCDMADMLVVLSRSCDTPARPPTQFPVAREWISLLVRISGLMEGSTIAFMVLLPFFLSLLLALARRFSTWYLRSFIRALKLFLNRSSIRSPERLSLLLA